MITLSLARPGPYLAHFTPLIKIIPLKFASISNSTPWSWLIFTSIGRRKLIRYCKCSNLLLLKVSFNPSYNSCHQSINHRQNQVIKKMVKKAQIETFEPAFFERVVQQVLQSQLLWQTGHFNLISLRSADLKHKVTNEIHDDDELWYILITQSTAMWKVERSKGIPSY